MHGRCVQGGAGHGRKVVEGFSQLIAFLDLVFPFIFIFGRGLTCPRIWNYLIGPVVSVVD